MERSLSHSGQEGSRMGGGPASGPKFIFLEMPEPWLLKAFSSLSRGEATGRPGGWPPHVW